MNETYDNICKLSKIVCGRGRRILTIEQISKLTGADTGRVARALNTFATDLYWRRISPQVAHMNSQYGSHEKDALDRITVEQVLSVLSTKEHDTIILWAQGKTLREISEKISVTHENRTLDNSLSPRAMGARINTILRKLRESLIKPEITK